MTKHRRRVDILADIVHAAIKGARKTRIMHAANLSYELLEKYLSDTLDVGLLQVSGSAYEATEKGRNFLELYSRFSAKYSRLEKDLESRELELETLERMIGPTLRNNSYSKNVQTKVEFERR